MSKHTPGPWWPEQNEHGHWTIRANMEICGHPGSFELCSLYGRRDGMETDARLIALSPEMEEFLEMIAASTPQEAYEMMPFYITRAKYILRQIDGEERG